MVSEFEVNEFWDDEVNEENTGQGPIGQAVLVLAGFYQGQVVDRKQYLLEMPDGDIEVFQGICESPRRVRSELLSPELLASHTESVLTIIF